MTDVHISIIVYKGSPLDYPHYRHTAIWLQFADGSTPLLAHAIGSRQDFTFECKEIDDPRETRRYAKTVQVGMLTIAATPAQMLSAMRSVPVDNEDLEFDCQKWVEGALRRLKTVGLLADEAYERGVDGMVDAVAEAEDVEEC